MNEIAARTNPDPSRSNGRRTNGACASLPVALSLLILLAFQTAGISAGNGLLGPIAVDLTNHKICVDGLRVGDTSGHTGIYLFKADGTSPVQLTDFSYDDSFQPGRPMAGGLSSRVSSARKKPPKKS
jgi:hypothetical protein